MTERPNCIYDQTPMHIHAYTKDGRKTFKCPECNFVVREGTPRAERINHLMK
jgi:uncharacterized C2H2 Zn-finger protein